MLKYKIKSIFRRLGFDIKQYNIASSDSAQLKAMLDIHKINLVFDVGANIGQFGKTIRDNGFQGRIISFEPLSSAYRQLLKISHNDALWEVAPRAAIGNENGSIEINISFNSQSSSILGILDNHLNAAPKSQFIGNEIVPIYRLDTLGMKYLTVDSILFLKVDTQGYEDRVLKGSFGILDRIKGFQLELSLVHLYEGQLLFDELIEQIKELGFELWSISPVFVDPITGRLLQVDATFFRK